MAKATREKMVLVLVVLSLISVCRAATPIGRKKLTNLEIRKELKRLNKPAIKSIKSEDGDIIDCVDIYKQPAFDHPLLKNHTIQMRPSFYDGKKMSSLEPPLEQLWHKSGSCPKGTIPIRRTRKEDLLRTISSKGLETSLPSQIEYAKLVMEGENHGVEASINAWNVHVEPSEFSMASIYVRKKDKSDFVNTGWMQKKKSLLRHKKSQIYVHQYVPIFGGATIHLIYGYYVNPVRELELPIISKWGRLMFLTYLATVSQNIMGDNNTRLYSYWRADAGAGCYNLKCPGFVQTSHAVALGSTLNPLSTYDGNQYWMFVRISMDPADGHWWLVIMKESVGYWPNSLFKNMVGSADLIEWSGEVLNTRPAGTRHTTTQMGSGHFSKEGYKKAAFFDDCVYLVEHDAARKPSDAYLSASRLKCYDVSAVSKGRDRGLFFYFGGPGGPFCDI